MKFQYLGHEFFTSTFSDRGRHCVAVSIQRNSVLVTNSKNPEAILSFTFEEWRAFISGAKHGEFDLDEGGQK
mgnify:CR=1 FL=1